MRRMWASLALTGLVLAGCSPAPAPVTTGTGAGSESTVTDSPVSVETGDPAATDSGTPAGAGTETPAIGQPPAEPTLIPATGAPPAADTPAAPATPPAGDASASPGAPAGTDAAPAPGTDATPKPAAGDAPKLETVPLSGGVATLTPENTKIQFVGTHVGAKPDPRTGGFAKFTGQAKVDPASKALQTVSVDIDTNSVFTSFEKLTNHLRTADFLEVREFPKAKFESTKIAPGEGGQAQITGNLTLHGQTKEITFPATVQVSDEGLTLQSEFTIDRSQFGMTYSPDKVDNKVALSVVIGEKSSP